MNKPYISPKERKDFKVIKIDGIYIKTLKNQPLTNSCK